MNAKHHIKRVTIIGAGNVGHNFGLAFRQAGYLIAEIYSRTQNSAMLLSQTLNCNFTTNLKQLSDKTDLFVIAVNDDVIEDVIAQIPHTDKPIVHTSGSTPIEVFEGKGFEKYGIFYPVQSFSKHETESLTPIPICVEANSSKTEDLFLSLASSVSSKVYSLDSSKRKALHVAAVFANNFTNHMFHIAHELLAKNKISFEIIRPLIEKTALKIKHENPVDAQTGPAIRNDRKVIDEHLKYLENNKDYQEVYEIITRNIYKSQQNK
jgi:predicted short-subunit dehydrogenase-like oxidoreductase (DUF2520 family)